MSVVEANDGGPGAGVATEKPVGIAPGAQIVVRDELWLVRKTQLTEYDGLRIEATGVSEFVRDTEAVFFESLDEIEALDPHDTVLVPDASREHRVGRLYLEAVIRKSFLPQTEHGLALADGFLMDAQAHQQRPAELALSRIEQYGSASVPAPVSFVHVAKGLAFT